MELYAGKLRFCHDTRAWFEWDGNVWKPNHTGLAFHWARELARKLSKDENEKNRYIISKTALLAVLSTRQA